MASTNTITGRETVSLAFLNTFGTDSTGQRVVNIDLSKVFDANNITVSGWLHSAAVVCAAGNWLLAHATNPFQAMSASVYSDGLSPGTLKIKMILIINSDATNTITVKRAAANSLPLFDTASAGVVIQPGGHYMFYDPTGATCGALTTGVNDALTIAVGGGTPNAEVFVVYGP